MRRQRPRFYKHLIPEAGLFEDDVFASDESPTAILQVVFLGNRGGAAGDFLEKIED